MKTNEVFNFKMKAKDIFNFNNDGNKYDMAIRTFYLIFYAAALIIFFTVGLNSMELKTWIIAFFCAAFGATVYGTIAKMIITMIRKDKQKRKADTLIKLFRIVFFSLSTVAFLAIGFQENNTKAWIIAFVGSYGASAIFSAISQLIITLAGKDK